MAAYAFSAVDSDNALHRGRLEAASDREAIESLSQQGLTVIAVDEVLSRSERVFSKRSANARTDARTFEALVSEWSHLLGIGLTIDQAVRFSAGSHTGTRLGRDAEAIDKNLRSGMHLEAALAAHLGTLVPTVRTAIAAGERSGRLPEALARLGSRLRDRRAFTSQIRSALLYPAFVLATAVGVLVILLIDVVPSIAESVGQNGQDLPWNAALVFGASAYVEAHGTMLLVVVTVVLAACLIASRQAGVRRAAEGFGLKLPLVGDIMLAKGVGSLCRDIAIQMQGGQTLVQAIASAHGSLGLHHFRDRAEELGRRVAEGERLSDAAAACLGRATALPAFIRVGEQSGRLAELLDHAADHYELHVRKRLGQISNLATPIITAVTGLLVGAIVLSIMSALVGLNDVVLR